MWRNERRKPPERLLADAQAGVVMAHERQPRGRSTTHAQITRTALYVTIVDGEGIFALRNQFATTVSVLAVFVVALVAVIFLRTTFFSIVASSR